MLEQYTNNRTICEPMRQVIARHVDEYLADGGVVEVIPNAPDEACHPTASYVRLSDSEL